MAGLKYLIFCVAAYLTFISNQKLNEISKAHAAFQKDEVLYLPSGRGLEFISFGYKNALAHTLWFNAISYFGKHYKSDRNYDWLYHMCGLVSDLNPKMHHVYDFCSLMLAWEANLPAQSIQVLDKGIKAFPNDWKFPYLRGMTYLIFMKDTVKAKDDFILSSSLPEAHILVKRLAAKNITLTERKENAIEFLEEMINNSNNKSEKEALFRKLEEIKREDNE